MTYTKHIDKELFSEYMEYDETCKSCLKWIKRPYKARIIVGSEVGTVASTGYFIVGLLGKQYNCHRIVAVLHGMDIDSKFIDHIDGNRANNKVSNLRVCDFNTNARNRKLHSKNVTGVTGICFNSRDKCYYAFWTEDGKNKKIGFKLSRFESEEKAFEAAVECREDNIERLNKLGYNYSERHGLNNTSEK